MIPLQTIYPHNPTNVPGSITEPSVAFKKQVSVVMGSIVFFFIIYLLLLSLSIALAVGCVSAGVSIIVNFPRIITIFAGLGLIGVGIMVFIFLVKFMFSVARYDRSDIIEVTEETQPTLFAFIRQLTSDTRTPFPKKIFLSADVNACVFYDSSFWSMFFPVRKNLQIGLGLVNTLNVSEFKAVMAHEFGHFSQRSMKLGSFVYNVNRVIHNMLYENKGYSNFLQGWANLDGVFALFAAITAKIAQSIQWILKQVYGLVNKNYMGLSREMEFHADAVAASVSGSESLVTALRRVELASSGYTITLQKCDELFRQKKISGNIYRNQSAVLHHLASEFKLPIQNGVPVVSDEFLANSNLSRVNFKDQWASHPTTEDRECHLKSLNVPAEIRTESAWILFENKDVLETEFTDKIYEHLKKEEGLETVTDLYFENKLKDDANRFTLPQVYQGFYDNREIGVIDDFGSLTTSTSTITAAELFTTDNASITKKINAIQNDIEILKAISEKRVQTKTFDFDGVKYKRNEAGFVVGQLEKELNEMRSRLEELDKQAILFFYHRALRTGIGNALILKSKYEDYFNYRTQAKDFLNVITGMLDSLQLIYSGQTLEVTRISLIINDLKAIHEPAFKKKLNFWLDQGAFDKHDQVKQNIQEFINKNYHYFTGQSFFNEELMNLNETCNESWNEVNKWIFEKFKGILEYQVGLLSVVPHPVLVP